MAHAMKLTRGALSGTVRHDERGGEDRFVTRKNESIDPARTHMNYSLTPPALQLTPLERVNELCETEGINIAKRKDLNVAVSWVVTLPPSVTEVEQERFFYETKRFLDMRYGYKDDKNVLCAQIHLDETTPHLHYVFVPVWYDAKNHRHTVSAKNVLNRQDLRTFHKDLTEHMRGVFGRDVGIETGITAEQGGNKSITELKAETRKNYAESKQALKSAQNERECIVSESKAKGREIIGAAEKAVRERLRASEGQAAEILQRANELADSGEFPENVYQTGGVLSKKATMQPETAEKMRKTANTARYMHKQAEETKQENTLLTAKIEKLGADIDNKANEIALLQAQLSDKENKIKAYKRTVRYLGWVYDPKNIDAAERFADEFLYYAENGATMELDKKAHYINELFSELNEKEIPFAMEFEDNRKAVFICLKDNQPQVQALIDGYVRKYISVPENKVKSVQEFCRNNGIKFRYAEKAAPNGEMVRALEVANKDYGKVKNFIDPQRPIIGQGQSSGRHR